MANTIVSVAGGRAAQDAPAGTPTSVNPSLLPDVVAEVTFASDGTFAAGSTIGRNGPATS